MTIKELHKQIKNDYLKAFPNSTYLEYENFLKGFYKQLVLSWKLEDIEECNIKIVDIEYNQENKKYTVYYKIDFTIYDLPNINISTNEINKEIFTI